MGTCGIYVIKNQINGHRYVGQSVDCEKRFVQHRSSLRRGDHHGRVLQRAWNLHGEAAFSFMVLFRCRPFELDRHEGFLLKSSSKPEYNCATDPRAPHRGRAMPAEVRAKIGTGLRGRPKTAAHRTRISAGRIGMKFTPEHVENHARALRGRKHSAAHKEKIGAASRGRKQSAEHIESRAKVRRIPVERVALDTGAVVWYESSTAAERDGFQQGNIAKVLAGDRKTHGGFFWRYAEKA